MFTGIVEEVARVKNISYARNSAVLTIVAKKVLEDVKIGDSIAVNGVCLTVREFSSKEFVVDIMHETLRKSSLRNIKNNSSVNLERAMLLNGRFGGHIVSGHIDGTGEIIDIRNDDNAVWYMISTEKKILKYVIEKGSIAIDGISLTIAELTESSFSVSIIPHTQEESILKNKKIGDIVNLENDCIGKYIGSLMKSEEENNSKKTFTMDFLLENGF